MKNLIASLVFALCGCALFADDIIVTRDGDIINSKVTEISKTEVKYKKASNPDGPTFVLEKSDIMVINYENGEKEVFSNADSERGTSKAKTAANPEKNEAAKGKFNQGSPAYLGDDVQKTANEAALIFGLTNGSVIADNNAELTFRSGYRKAIRKGSEIVGREKFTQQPLGDYIEVTLKNNTDDVIYIDLAKSYFDRNGVSQSYYVPQATTNTAGTTSGSAIGIGAVVVGGAVSSSQSTTTFSQQILSLPPHSSINIDAVHVLFDIDAILKSSRNMKLNFTDACRATKIPGIGYGSTTGPTVNFGKASPLMRGEHLTYNEDDTNFRFRSTIAYSTDEDFSTVNYLNAEFYIKDVIGYNQSATDTEQNRTREKTFSDIYDFVGISLHTKADKDSVTFPRK